MTSESLREKIKGYLELRYKVGGYKCCANDVDEFINRRVNFLSEFLNSDKSILQLEKEMINVKLNCIN